MSFKDLAAKERVVSPGISAKSPPEEKVRDAPPGAQPSAETDDRAIKVEPKTKA